MTKISAGTHSGSVGANGCLYVWGKSKIGKFLSPYETESIGESMIEISIGHNFGAAVSESGRVWTWGNNEFGQLGCNDTTPKVCLTEVSRINSKRVFQISAGGSHIAALGEILSKSSAKRSREKKLGLSSIQHQHNKRIKRRKSSNSKTPTGSQQYKHDFNNQQMENHRDSIQVIPVNKVSGKQSKHRKRESFSHRKDNLG